MQTHSILGSGSVFLGYPCGFVCSLLFMTFGMLGDIRAAVAPTCLTYPTQFLLPAIYRYAVKTPPEPVVTSVLTWPNTPPSLFYGVVSGEVYWNSLGAGKQATLLSFYFSDPSLAGKGMNFILTGLSSTSFDLSATDLAGSKTQTLYKFTAQEAFFIRVGLNYNTAGTPSVQILKASGGGTFEPVVYVTDTTIRGSYAAPSAHPSFTVTIGGTQASGDFVGSLYNFQLNYIDTEANSMASMSTPRGPVYPTTSDRRDHDRIYANPDPFYAVHRWDTASFATKHIVFQDPNFSGLSIFMRGVSSSSASDPLTTETDNGISLGRFGFAQNKDPRIADSFRSVSVFQHVLTTRVAVVFGSDLVPVLTGSCTAYMAFSDALRTHILYGFKFKQSYYDVVPLASQVWAVVMRVVSCSFNSPNLEVGVQFFLKSFGDGVELPAAPPSTVILSTGVSSNNITVAIELSQGLVSRDILGKARVYVSPEGASVLAANIDFSIASTKTPGTTYSFTDFIGNFADDAPEISYFPLFRLVYKMAQYSTGELLLADEACEAPTSKLFIGNRRLALTKVAAHPIICYDPAELPANFVCLSLQPTGSCKLYEGMTCRACNHGYFNSTGTCTACGSGCQSCISATSCKKCMKGFYRNGPNCVDYTTVQAATNLYYPAGQALVTDGVQPEWTPNTLLPSCAAGAYYCRTTTYNLAGPSLHTLLMTFELEPSDTEAFRSFGSVILLLNNLPVAYNVLQSKTDVAILTYIGTDLAPGTYLVEIRAYGTLKIKSGKVAYKAHDYTVPCLMPTADSRCLACNYHNYRSDGGGACALLPVSNGVGFGTGYQTLSEYSITCDAGVARCKPNQPAKAYVCLPGYFLSGESCLQCTAPCDTCTTSATTCDTCKPGFIPNPAGVAPFCIPPVPASCPDQFYMEAVTSLCTPCVAPCRSCTSASSCSTCLPGYTSSGDKCFINCLPGFYRNAALNVCEKCSESCMACTSNLDCSTCTPGFLFDDSKKQCVLASTASALEVKVELTWNKATKLLSIIFSQSILPTLLDETRLQLKYNTSVLSIDESFRKSGEKTRLISLKVDYLMSKTEILSEPVILSITSPIEYSDSLSPKSSLSADKKRILQEIKYRVPVQETKLAGGISYYQDQASTRAVQTTAKVVTTSAVAVSSVVALAQGGGSLTSLIKLTQYTEALLLTNIDFPSNFRKFIAGFSGYFVQLLTNPLDDYGYSGCELPDPFVAQSYSCLYVQNNSISMIVFACFGFFKLMVWTITILLAKCGKHPKYLIKVNKVVNLSLFFGLLDSAIFDLTLPALINLQKSLQSDLYSILNILLSIFSLIFVCVLLAITWILSKAHPGSSASTSGSSSSPGGNNPEDLRSLKSGLSDRNPELTDSIKEFPPDRHIEAPGKTTTLFGRMKHLVTCLDLKFASEGFKEQNPYGRHKIFMVQVFTVLNSFNLAFLSQYPIVQIVLLAAPQTCLAFATLWSRPYESRLANLKEGVVELLLAIASIISVTLVSNPQVIQLTEYSREAKIGITLIVVVGIIFFLMFLCSLIEGLMALKEYGVNIWKATQGKSALKERSQDSMSQINRPGSALSESRIGPTDLSAKPRIFWPSSKGISTTPKSNTPQAGWSNKVKVTPATPKMRQVKMVKPQ